MARPITADAATAIGEKPEAILDDREIGSSNASTIPGRNVAFQPPSRYVTRHTIEFDDYFSGPRDMQKHSKLPFFMRVHGSVLPKMVLPLSFVGAWATTVTCVSKLTKANLGVDTVLLTVLGFVVGFALSFRCATAYERYSEGRKYWAQLTLTSRNLARLVWINIVERPDAEAVRATQDTPALPATQNYKKDLLGKISAINLINAFSMALKHRLRFEPAVDYPDLLHLVSHLPTMASKADQSKLRHKKQGALHALGEHLGVTFALSNPRKLIKRSQDNLGNLPNEILNYLSAYLDQAIGEDKIVPIICTQNLLYSDVRVLADILTGTERILNTPLPLAYSISIAQITWAYIMVLPFQLFSKLDWVTIPATILAAYIILGLAIIGREIENPFGNDVNDLPLEAYCNEIAADLDVLTSIPREEYKKFIEGPKNRPLFPLSYTSIEDWENESVEDIRNALKAKATSSSQSVQLQRVKTELADIETV